MAQARVACSHYGWAIREQSKSDTPDNGANLNTIARQSTPRDFITFFKQQAPDWAKHDGRVDICAQKIGAAPSDAVDEDATEQEPNSIAQRLNQSHASEADMRPFATDRGPECDAHSGRLAYGYRYAKHGSEEDKFDTRPPRPLHQQSETVSQQPGYTHERISDQNAIEDSLHALHLSWSSP